MIDRDDAEHGFARLRILMNSGALDQGSFVVERVDDEGLRFLAVSSSGAAALILATSASSAVPPLRLAGLRVDYGINCVVVESGERREIRASIISTASNGQSADDLFATLCASLADSVPSAPTDRDVATEIDRWSRLFWRLSQPAHTDLIGLAGELVCIAESHDANRWVRAWHPRPEDRFDFTFLPGRGVVEVKSTAKDRRLHEIALGQVTGPHLDSQFIASVRVVDGPTSLGDIVRDIADGLRDDASLLALWNVLTLTCGAGLDEALAFHIDLDIARTSIRYYEAASIPRPVVEQPLPLGVSNIRFSADLDLTEAVDRQVLETVLHDRSTE